MDKIQYKEKTQQNSVSFLLIIQWREGERERRGRKREKGGEEKEKGGGRKRGRGEGKGERRKGEEKGGEGERKERKMKEKKRKRILDFEALFGCIQGAILEMHVLWVT